MLPLAAASVAGATAAVVEAVADVVAGAAEQVADAIEQAADAVAPVIAPAQAVPLSRRAARAARTSATGAQSTLDAPGETAEHTADVAAPSLENDASQDESFVQAVAAGEPGQTHADLIFDEPFLQEPVATSAPEAEPLWEPAAFDADLDEFEAAARLFSFTAETPVQTAAAADASADEASATAESAVAPEARRGASFRRLATASFSLGVVGVVGLLAVGMTTPAQAVAAASGSTAALSVVAPAGGDVAADEDEIQAYVAPATVENVAVSRSENYSMVSMAQIAADEGITNTSDFYVNDPTSNIQWPFAVGVPITYGFGWRSGAMHEGADFVPGQGAPVQAIADGTVRIATESGGAYGVTVVIDHIIDGQLVSTRYGHMLYGSLKVTVGQKVTVGTVIGNTGNTGRSFGAHTHVEVLLNGTTPTDPIVWLREYTDGSHEVG